MSPQGLAPSNKIRNAESKMEKESKFGSSLWGNIRLQPLGSLTKKELELVVMRAAIDSGLVGATPAEIAQTFRLGLAKAHGYLTDLALRSPVLKDVEAMQRLQLALRQAEVTPDRNHLAIPLNDAGLRIWLERKLASQQLQQGESLRRELVKLTPAALNKLLDSALGLQKPHVAFKALQKQFGKEAWFNEATSHWKPNTPWVDALKDVGIETWGSVVSVSLACLIRG